jgi:hypothetical protein
MPKRLKRIYGFGHLHFITFSCYRRLPLLGSAHARNVFVQILNEKSETSSDSRWFAAATATTRPFARGGWHRSHQACLPGMIYRAPTKTKKKLPR